MKKLLLVSLCFLMLCITQVYAQNRTITGTVTSKDDGLPLPGVSVTIKGSTTGTQTGIGGQFSLSVSNNSVLVFSFIGYKPLERTVGSANRLNIELITEATQLNEVVVSGAFGINRPKKSLGYGTATVSAESITAVQNNNFTNSLAGKVSGVQIAGSGGAFTGSSILIRGNVTFTGNNQPLIVVDGVPIDNGGGNTPLQSGPSLSNRGIDINPEDIESTTVLKSAAATVLYGSRAASGAILIVTKRGSKNQKSRIEFTSTYGIANPDRLPEYQNQYGQGSRGTFNPSLATSWGPEIKGQEVTNFFGTKEALKAYPDNVKDFFQTGKNIQNNIAFTGGSDNTTYRVSYGNDYNTYVIPGNVLKKNNISVNARTDISSKLRVGTSFTYVNNVSKRSQQGNQLSNPLFRGWFTPRSYDLTNLPFEDADGQQTWFGTTDNPYWTVKHNLFNDETNRIFGNINLNYNVNDWITADLKVGEDYYGYNSSAIDDIGNKGGGNSGTNSIGVGGLATNSNTYRNLNSYFTLTGSRTYGDFNFSLALGNEYLDNYQQYNNVNAFTLALPGFRNLSNATQFFPSNASYHSRTIGLFADFVVDYKKWLTVNVKGRNDWTSTLEPANRSIFYQAIATSLVLTDALPQLKSNVVSNIKLRANYGKVGKGTDPYNTRSVYTIGGSSDGFGPAISFPFNGLSAFALGGSAGNPALTPEFTKEYEFGGELGFFNNRLTIDASYYKRKSDHIILGIPVPNSTGLGNYIGNAGKLRSNGVELAVSGIPVKTSNFQWTIGGTFTRNRSVVESLADNVSNIFLGGFVTPNIRLVAGDQYGQIYGSAYQRDAQGRLLLTDKGLPLPSQDVQKIGNPNPNFNVGITNTISYNGISLYFLVDIRSGGDLYSRNFADVERNGVAASTAEFPRFNADGSATTPYIFDGVIAPGFPGAGSANTVHLSAQDYYGNSGKYVAAEGYIHDISWYRLREANLSYSLPKNLLAKTPFGRASLGIYGRNLILITPHYKHFDPEQNALGINNAQGLEFNSLPATREVGLNLKVTF
jgi:TonB-linked SusC/RagA family outer membrane protein